MRSALRGQATTSPWPFPLAFFALESGIPALSGTRKRPCLIAGSFEQCGVDEVGTHEYSCRCQPAVSLATLQRCRLDARPDVPMLGWLRSLTGAPQGRQQHPVTANPSASVKLSAPWRSLLRQRVRHRHSKLRCQQTKVASPRQGRRWSSLVEKVSILLHATGGRDR